MDAAVGSVRPALASSGCPSAAAPVIA